MHALNSAMSMLNYAHKSYKPPNWKHLHNQLENPEHYKIIAMSFISFTKICPSSGDELNIPQLYDVTYVVDLNTNG